MNRRAGKGQALVELVIVLPLFAALLMAATLWADLTLKKLELIRLTRDFAVLLARSDHSEHGPKDFQNQLRLLADKTTRLESRHLSYSLEPLPPSLTQQQDPRADQAMALPGMGGVVQAMLLGQRLKLVYTLQYRGLLGLALPGGIQLKETVALKTDPWTSPFNRLLRWLGYL